MRFTRREVAVVAVSAAVLAAVAIGATVALSGEDDSFATPADTTVERTSSTSTTTPPSTTRPANPEQWFLDEIAASDASVTRQLPDDAQLGIARDQCDRMATGTSWGDAVRWMVERTDVTHAESATVTTAAAIAFCPDELPES